MIYKEEENILPQIEQPNINEAVMADV